MDQASSRREGRPASLRWLSTLLVLAAAGCGGGGSDPAPAPAPAAMPTIAAAVNLDDNHQVGTLFWPDGDTATGGQGATVANVPCAPVNETFHIHSHLSIFVNGQAEAIPANIGIIQNATTDCHYYVHTHDHSGKIHMEAPVTTGFTLGQLFAIWGQPLTSTNVAGVTGLPMALYITENGTVTLFTGDPNTIPMLSHRHIAIVLGTPIAQVPFFTWTAN
jgi:hypothetical protein